MRSYTRLADTHEYVEALSERTTALAFFASEAAIDATGRKKNG